MGKSEVQAVKDVTKWLGLRWSTWRLKVMHDARRSFGRSSHEDLRCVRRYGVFRDIGKPVFGRVSGPLIHGRDRILYPCRCGYGLGL